MDILIAIRAYNEAKNLPTLIEKIIKEGYKEILIVDDCSTDNTKEVVNNLIKKHSNVKIYYVRHVKNTNMGGALLTEFKVAKKLNKHLITLDGDLQHDPKDVIKFVKEINDYDVLFGNRYKGKVYRIPFYRKLLHLLNFLFNFIISGKKLVDIHNGFRAYNKKVLPIFEKELVYFDGSYADNVFYITAKYKLKYKEVPITIKYTEETLKKGQKVHKTFLKILIKSFLLRVFSLEGLLLLGLFPSLIFSLIIYFLTKNLLVFVLVFSFSLGTIYTALVFWYRYVKKDKELKDLISEISIKELEKQKVNKD